jgi:hypothetical protein
MSEHKTNFMAELDAWTDEFIVDRLAADSRDISQGILEEVRYAIREKVRESYKNGLRAGAGSVRREMRESHSSTAAAGQRQ